jgi:hypothetical protein
MPRETNSSSPVTMAYEAYRSKRANVDPEAEIAEVAERDYLSLVTDKRSGRDIYSPGMFDIDEFRHRLDISVCQQARTPEVSHLDFQIGLFVTPVGKKKILLPELAKRDLRTFYIALQIGHIKFHLPQIPPNQAVVFPAYDVAPQVMSQATEYAFELLLPRKMFERLRELEGGEDAETLETLSRNSSVNFSIVQERFSYLQPQLG